MDVTLDETVKSVFDEECSGLEIGPKLVKALVMFEQNFVNKNDEHIAFFGGNLFGVNVVRFTNTERDRWFDEILQADETYLRERTLALPDIREDWIVSSDTMNLSCIWLAHAIKVSPKLSPKDKHEGMVAVMLILQYKFFTSRYYRHFQFPAQKAIAEALHASLSGKFLIKKFGNWRALFLYRAEEIVGPQSIHFRTLEKMDDDGDVIRMLNDIQGRIRDMLKNMYGEYLRIRDSGSRIITSSLILEHDGESILKDKKKSVSEYHRYITNIITDKNSFIRDELVDVIASMINTMPVASFRETLSWMSDNYRQNGAEIIETVISETIVHSIDYLSTHRGSIRNKSDLPAMLITLKGGYMSSRSTDPALYDLRQLTEDIVRMATHSKNISVISAVRTGVLLYIVLRSYTMRHYSNQ